MIRAWRDAMKFTCERCHKPYSTADDPVPGRLYRIPCRCGNTIVLQVDPPPVVAPRRARTAPPPLPTPLRAVRPSEGAAPAVPAELVEQDVTILADELSELAGPDVRDLLARASDPVTPTQRETARPRGDREAPSRTLAAPDASLLAEEVRRTRMRTLAGVGVASAAVGALCAAVVTALVLRSGSPPAPGVVAAEAASRDEQAATRREPDAPPARAGVVPAHTPPSSGTAASPRRVSRDRGAASVAPERAPATPSARDEASEPAAEPAAETTAAPPAVTASPSPDPVEDRSDTNPDAPSTDGSGRDAAATEPDAAAREAPAPERAP
jgi:hypothetical protein